MDGFPRLGLAASHFDIHKYSSPGDPKYERVLPQLKQMIMDAPGRAHARLYREMHTSNNDFALC